MNNFINQLFDRLDQWKAFPTYQLERRTDIFFAMYLPLILESKLRFKVDKILPEFPVRLGDIEGREETNRSYRIDYVAVDLNQKRVLLIELKTDQKSVRKDQIGYLRAANDLGISKLMNGFQQIKKHSKAKKKYETFETELNDLKWNITEVAESYTTEIVFIAPNSDEVISEFEVITFQYIADILKMTYDPIAHRFAESLLRWQ